MVFVHRVNKKSTSGTIRRSRRKTVGLREGVFEILRSRRGPGRALVWLGLSGQRTRQAASLAVQSKSGFRRLLPERGEPKGHKIDFSFFFCLNLSLAAEK